MALVHIEILEMFKKELGTFLVVEGKGLVYTVLGSIGPRKEVVLVLFNYFRATNKGGCAFLA